MFINRYSIYNKLFPSVNKLFDLRAVPLKQNKRGNKEALNHKQFTKQNHQALTKNLSSGKGKIK